jgi:hypothetical protein
MYRLNLKESNLWKGVCRSTFIALTVTSLMLAASAAKADCGNLAGFKPGVFSKLPLSALPATGQAASTSIVGLWHVTYSAGGQLFYEAFDQWHSDGTEFENANLPAVLGNVCMGVWKRVSSQTVRLILTAAEIPSGPLP